MCSLVNKEKKRLWKNGVIASMDDSNTFYDAIGVQNGKIIYLSKNSEDYNNQSWDEIIDLQGHLMLPGFNDTHMHLLQYSLFYKNVSLVETKTIDEIISKCREFHEREKGQFILGFGWNNDNLQEKRMPTKEDCDKIATDVPVILLRACVHIGTCNTKMLEMIKARRENIGEELYKYVDFENGFLVEDATQLYMKLLPGLNDDYIKSLIQFGQKELNANGITCVHPEDFKSLPIPFPQLINIYHELERDNKLSVRVYSQCQVSEKDFDTFLKLKTQSFDDHESLFRTGPIKLFTDGSLGAKTAALINGYLDDPSNHGIMVISDEDLYKAIKRANDHHINVAVHAIGDLAIQKLCDIFERVLTENPWPEHRHGIIHVQITNQNILERMRKYNIQSYVQPIFIDYDMDIVDSRVGSEYAKGCYNWKTMIDLGIHTSGGSDCPVEPFNVLENLYTAVTRKNRRGDKIYLPDQKLSVAEGVKLFTTYAAWASYDENIRGMLKEGYQADMVVLDRNIFTIPEDEIKNAKVLQTILNGCTVYSA